MKFNHYRKSIFSRFRTLMTGVAIALAALPALADATMPVSWLEVELRNGNKESFKLADKPVVTFNGDECVIDCNSLTATYDMADIKIAKLVSDPTAAEAIAKENVMLDLTNPDLAVITGVETGNVVNVYSITGSIVASAMADATGRVELDLSGLQHSTVYIVSVNADNNFKLIRK